MNQCHAKTKATNKLPSIHFCLCLRTRIINPDNLVALLAYTRTKRKFGERAPWMDAELFDELLAKARAKGYLRKSE